MPRRWREAGRKPPLPGGRTIYPNDEESPWIHEPPTLEEEEARVKQWRRQLRAAHGGRAALDPEQARAELYAAWQEHQKTSNGERPTEHALAVFLCLSVSSVQARKRVLQRAGIPWPPPTSLAERENQGFQRESARPTR